MEGDFAQGAWLIKRHPVPDLVDSSIPSPVLPVTGSILRKEDHSYNKDHSQVHKMYSLSSEHQYHHWRPDPVCWIPAEWKSMLTISICNTKPLKPCCIHILGNVDLHSCYGKLNIPIFSFVPSCIL